MKRPSLPVGHKVRESLYVQRAHYAADDVEVYFVADHNGLGERLLLLSKADSPLIKDWWNTLCDPVFQQEESPPAGRSKDFPGAFLVPISGNPIRSEEYRQASSDEVVGLLFKLIDSTRVGAARGMIPRLDSQLCWSDTEGHLTALFPLGSFEDEASLVGYVAASFYSLVTGIDVASRSNPAPLSQWCKGASVELSRIVAACFLDERGRQTTHSLAKLESDLGRRNSTDMPDNFTVAKGDKDADAGATGLARVAGMHQLKELLQREVVEPLRNPEPYRKYGLSIPNGILLYGPPGCGKTYIARALAEELGHHFVEVVPSELASPYVHGSVIRIREVFDDAIEHAPAVVFIDEFEALAPVRSGLGGFQQYRVEEVNEVLTHLNDSAGKGVFVVAATNQPELIDPAVRRTGRLDKLIYVGPPDPEARREMLRLHLGERPVSAELNLDEIAGRIAGYSASDIRFLVDEAARYSLVRREAIAEDAFDHAISRMVPSVPPALEAEYQSIESRGH